MDKWAVYIVIPISGVATNGVTVGIYKYAVIREGGFFLLAKHTQMDQ